MQSCLESFHLLSFIRSRKLDRLFEERRERLYRLANSWCHDAMLADDLVQATLGKALQKNEQLKDLSKLDAWLFRILHNTWMEHLRKHRPTLDLDDIYLLEKETPESNLSNQQLVTRVHQAVASLPMPQRQVITLVDLEGCSYALVSEVLDIPIGTVMSRLSRARATLKKRLIGVRQASSSLSQPAHLRRVK